MSHTTAEKDACRWPHEYIDALRYVIEHTPKVGSADITCLIQDLIYSRDTNEGKALVRKYAQNLAETKLKWAA